MLFRRSTYYSFILLAVPLLSIAGENIDKYLKEGKMLGKSIESIELSAREIELITPKELQGKQFDSESARNEILSAPYHKTQDVHKADLDPAITAILENAETAVSQLDKDFSVSEGSEETNEKCIFEKGFSSVILQHTLSVQVIKGQTERKIVRVCNGHHLRKKSDDPGRDKSKTKSKLKNDPTVKYYSVTIDKQGVGHRDIVDSFWAHNDDAHTCDSYHDKEIETSSDKWEEIDTWNLDNPELLRSLDCTLISTETGEPETRNIEGIEISRPYWTKSHELKCENRHQNNCHFLREKICVLTSEKCIKEVNSQCEAWEKYFKCSSKRQHVGGKDIPAIYGTDGNLWETKYDPNNQLSDVMTKLVVFDEIKKELQNANVLDIRKVSLFSGNDQQCSKSILENVMYDCCSSMDGLATKVKFSKCTADELALTESRKKGLSHYVGKKKEKFLGLWESRTEHAFCIFPSKLSKVFQEEARKQLNISWGDADHPDCRGLTQDEIKRLDFSKLDLKEAFNMPTIKKSEEKIKRIEERLKQRLSKT